MCIVHLRLTVSSASESPVWLIELRDWKSCIEKCDQLAPALAFLNLARTKYVCQGEAQHIWLCCDAWTSIVNPSKARRVWGNVRIRLFLAQCNFLCASQSVFALVHTFCRVCGGHELFYFEISGCSSQKQCYKTFSCVLSGLVISTQRSYFLLHVMRLVPF